MFLELSQRGLINQKSIEELAAEEKMSASTLWRDWRRRGLWLGAMTQIEQSRVMLIQVLHEFKSVREEAWKTYTDARTHNSYNAAVGALHMITKNLIGEMNFRQSLGVMERAPIESKVEQIRTIKKAVVFLVEAIEKEDPGLLPQLLKVVKSVEGLEKIDKDFLEKAR